MWQLTGGRSAETDLHIAIKFTVVEVAAHVLSFSR